MTLTPVVFHEFTDAYAAVLRRLHTDPHYQTHTRGQLHHNAAADRTGLHRGTTELRVLAVVSTVGGAVRHVELYSDDHLGRWFADAAQDWARHHLETGIDEDDLRPAGVTEWRAVVYDDRQGWTPLFDTTDPGRLPWTDLTAATGSRHHQRAGQSSPPPRP